MKLKDFLTENGIKQNFFSDKIGISGTALASILQGKSTPSIPTAWAIEKATDGKVTLYDWVKELDVDSKPSIKSGKKKNPKINP